MLLFGAVGFTSAMLPFYSDKILGRCTGNTQGYMSQANAFGGGVLLSVGIMDLLNESVIMLADVNRVFPVSCGLAVVSYVVLLGFERLLLHDKGLLEVGEVVSENWAEGIDRKKGKELADGQPIAAENKAKPTDLTEKLEVPSNLKEPSPTLEIVSPAGLMCSPPTDTLASPDLNYGGQPLRRGRASKVYLLAIVLTIHTVLEGISLGILSEVATVINIFLGIIFHKFAAGLALGIYCSREQLTKFQSLPAVLAFSLAAPIGVLIGMKVQSVSSVSVIGVFLALASGTFIYISLAEIAEEEIKGAKALGTYLTFVGGVLVFTCILAVSAVLSF